ncbi:hypothetical protein GCM10010232_35940 [Streptomyces amakusaensis]
MQIDGERIAFQQVSVTGSGQHKAMALGFRFHEATTQPGDMDLKTPPGARRRFPLVPEQIDQPVGRNHPADVEQQ